jgi:hypothetical protein
VEIPLESLCKCQKGSNSKEIGRIEISVSGKVTAGDFRDFWVAPVFIHMQGDTKVYDIFFTGKINADQF